jgi:hypothetical protein
MRNQRKKTSKRATINGMVCDLPHQAFGNSLRIRFGYFQATIYGTVFDTARKAYRQLSRQATSNSGVLHLAANRRFAPLNMLFPVYVPFAHSLGTFVAEIDPVPYRCLPPWFQGCGCSRCPHQLLHDTSCRNAIRFLF